MIYKYIYIYVYIYIYFTKEKHQVAFFFISAEHRPSNNRQLANMKR